MSIEWAAVGRALQPSARSGDLHAVHLFDGGALVAAIDGLGHGEEAAYASQLAEQTLRADPSATLEALVERCHAKLKGTRGAVMSLARLDDGAREMTWTGVGNVEGVLLRADLRASPTRHTLVSLAGVVGGAGSVRFRPSTLKLVPGDTLLFATDGVRPDFGRDANPLAAPETAAQSVLERWGRDDDDALVVVARWWSEVP
jgi:serine phosphatase RsbU (regulator of sigma subunit)